MNRITRTQWAVLHASITRQAYELAEKYNLHGAEKSIRVKIRSCVEETFGCGGVRELSVEDFDTALVWVDNWEDTDYLRRYLERQASRRPKA